MLCPRHLFYDGTCFCGPDKEVMVRRGALLGGVGAIAFGVLMIVGLLVANPPGGTYSASDSIKYLASGHRVALFVALYLGAIAVLGLVCLLGYLRNAAAFQPGGELMARTFWAAGLAAAASFLVGGGIEVGPGLAHIYGGHHLTISPQVTYVISEVGAILLFGVGPILLGLALVILMFTAPAVLPGWLRWLTVIGGVAGILSPAFFPFFILLLWAIVTGIWILATGDRLEPIPVDAEPAAVIAGR